MIAKLLLDRKREGRELAAEEIRELIAAYTRGDVPDYQMAAFAMAVCCRGMTDAETLALTTAMRDSGECLSWDDLPMPTADKHSTGGVGDKLSLIIQPLAAACGLAVPSLTGRGLGLTGGTADKMESIPGMRIGLTEEEFIRQVREIGVAVVGQTGHLAPADKTLYALRDVTATVDSIPLIVSSILSKKLAAGSDAIVLDVKTGSGALMHDLESSIHLAEIMVRVGTMAGKPTVALISGMDQPLGTHVGNALEVKEAIDILAGRAGGDLKAVSLTLGGHMLVLAGRAKDQEEAVRMLEHALESGAGLRKLEEMITAQGGDSRVCRDLSLLPQAPVRKQILCGRSGYVNRMNTTALGLAAQAMGAGRMRAEDSIDYAAGYVLQIRIGDRVTPETPLCELHARTEADAERAEAAIRAAITFGDSPSERAKNFLAIVNKDGVRRL